MAAASTVMACSQGDIDNLLPVFRRFRAARDALRPQ